MAGSSAHPDRGFLARAHRYAFYAAIVYAALIAALAHPFVQRHVAYQHSIVEPWHTKMEVPEEYGLAPGKTLNTYIQTPDNVTLGAWFILADPYYQSLRPSDPYPASQPSIETVEDAIRTRPTILYFHGAAGSRATTWRIQHYHAWTARLQANIFVIDYRGFGDSDGTPSEAGLALDARTAWAWLIARGARPEDVLVVGHSLGTGVAGAFGAHLAREGVKPRGIVLLSPFSSLATLLETYALFGVPVLQPLQSFALGRKLVQHLVHDAYDTLSAISEFNVPTLIGHSLDDAEIPHTHSRTLLDKLLDPLLPSAVALPDAPVSHEQFVAFSEAQARRRDARAALVSKVELPNFGAVEEFVGVYGRVVYVEARWGAHSKIGLQEGVQDVIGSMFGLGQNA